MLLDAARDVAQCQFVRLRQRLRTRLSDGVESGLPGSSSRPHSGHPGHRGTGAERGGAGMSTVAILNILVVAVAINAVSSARFTVADRKAKMELYGAKYGIWAVVSA